jgi:hypothetical protein
MVRMPITNPASLVIGFVEKFTGDDLRNGIR